MGIASKAKNAGGMALGLIGLAAFLTIPVALLYGAAELSVWALEWTPGVFAAVFWASLLLLIPLALIPPARGLAALGFVVASYAFGLILWIWAMAFTYDVWGLVAVVIGLLFFGVGVVAVAFLAALIKGFWSLLGTFAFLLVLTYGTRAFGVWLGEKDDARRMERARAQEQAENIKPARKIGEPS